MKQLQKYTWLIETIRRVGSISHRDLSDAWVRKKDLSDGHCLPRATFNRWRSAIRKQFGINIECRHTDDYQYYIENPEDIDDDELKKWMLDSFATGNLIGENLALKNRILLDAIPSGQTHLTTLLEAMTDNRIVRITYHPFSHERAATFPIEPYCVKLFENRWYVLAHNDFFDDMRIYALDRIEGVEITDQTFRLPKEFSAAQYFSTAYGIVVGQDVKPRRIVIRANEDHKHYLLSLPLHHTQRLIADHGEYADFDVYLAPTYDFIMKLLQAGAMIEVISPDEVRNDIRGWISDMHHLYNDPNPETIQNQ